MDFKTNYFWKKFWRHKALLWYTFKIAVPFFCPSRNFMLQFTKNDGTVPTRWKNYLFLSFPESFYMFFTETHFRGLGLWTYWLSGRARRENIWLEVMAYGPSTARSVHHDRARPNSVNKHFIIWPLRFSFFFRVTKFGMFTYVAHFDRKVGIYIATKLF